MFFVTGGTPTPHEQVEQDVLPALLRCRESGTGFGLWALVRKADGASAWGQGYAAEAGGGGGGVAHR